MANAHGGFLHVMPMLIINMGGEMMYILEQRLRAQSIPPDKSSKVLVDVVRTMYNKKFIRELFKPQEMYKNDATRQIFDRLAHSSIMRLNESSMEKLYDLMTMGFKYQMLNCVSPRQLVTVSLNHMRNLQSIVRDHEVKGMIGDAVELVRTTYGLFSAGDFFMLKQGLCRFFQGRRVKVSLFLQDGLQNMDGSMVLDVSTSKWVPEGTELPGSVHYFDQGGAVRATVQLTGHNLYPLVTGGLLVAYAQKEGVGERCSLGDNLYAKNRAGSPVGKLPKSDSEYKSAQGAGGGSTSSRQPSTALAELNVLSGLIGGKARGTVKPIPIDLFAYGEDPFFGAQGPRCAGSSQEHGGHCQERTCAMPGNPTENTTRGDEAKKGDPGSFATATVQINGNAGRKDLRTQVAELCMGDEYGAKAPGKAAEDDESHDDDLLAMFDSVKES